MTYCGWIAFLGTGLALASSVVARGDDELRKLAAEAYQAGHIETGHLHLNQIIAQNPSNMEVTLETLEEILKQSRRSDAKLRAEQPNVPLVSLGHYLVFAPLPSSADAQGGRSAWKITSSYDASRS